VASPVGEDVGPNARRVLARFEPTARLTPAGEALLVQHDWPGDLEQLEAVVAGLGLDHRGRTIPLEAIVARLDRGPTSTSARPRLLPSGRVLRLPVRGRRSPDAGPLSRSMP
jgi:DNA-binding NtrC family response regulator